MQQSQGLHDKEDGESGLLWAREIQGAETSDQRWQSPRIPKMASKHDKTSLLGLESIHEKHFGQKQAWNIPNQQNIDVPDQKHQKDDFQSIEK